MLDAEPEASATPAGDGSRAETGDDGAATGDASIHDASQASVADVGATDTGLAESTVDASTGDASAPDASEADSSAGMDAAIGTEAAADASTQEAGDASEADVGSVGTNDDSEAPAGNDASTYDATPTPDASDASASAEDSGEPSSDAASSACGTTGLPCCSGEQCVDTELWCIAGLCSACGSTGQPCCGEACNGGNSCVATAGASECVGCGQPGQVCCTSLPACADTSDGCYSIGLLEACLDLRASASGQPGEECTSTCTDSSNVCWPGAPTSTVPFCIACGGLDLPCCGGTTCETDLSCGSSGYCE